MQYVPLRSVASAAISRYLEVAGLGALFRPLHHGRAESSAVVITPYGVYKIVRADSTALGFPSGAHALRATAATNALDHGADIAKVQDWLWHTNITTTRVYNRRTIRIAILPKSCTDQIGYRADKGSDSEHTTVRLQLERPAIVNK